MQNDQYTIQAEEVRMALEERFACHFAVERSWTSGAFGSMWVWRIYRTDIRDSRVISRVDLGTAVSEAIEGMHADGLRETD